MAYSTTPGMLHLSAGVLIGFGLSGASFPIVLAAFGKLLPRDVALLRVRHRHRRRLVRPVPVLAARRRAARRDRLAERRCWCLPSSCCSCCRWRSRSRSPATGHGRRKLERCRNPSARRWAKPSATAPTCCWCSASSPAASMSPSSPRTCRPIWSTRGSTPRGAAGCSRSSACSTSSARSRRGVLGEQIAEALPALHHLFLARDRHHGVPADADDARERADLRRLHGRALALHRSAHLRSRRADVRHPLHGDAVRLRVLLAPGRLVHRRLARRLPL